jgi:6-phosphogluconolactonase
MVRHPTLPRAYLVSELANTLTVLTVRGGGLFEAAQILTTLPSGFSGHSQAAHIAIDAAGRRLYLSNRGANTLVVFALDAGGHPSLLQHIACGGNWPRFFLLLERERRLLVANERSGEVAIFQLLGDGRLRDSGGRIRAPGTVFLMT